MAGRGGKTRTSGQGRPKGAINKINRDVRSMIIGSLNDLGGRKWLARQADKNPVAYMALLSKVLPLQLAGDPDNPLLRDAEVVIYLPDNGRDPDITKPRELTDAERRRMYERDIEATHRYSAATAPVEQPTLAIEPPVQATIDHAIPMNGTEIDLPVSAVAGQRLTVLFTSPRALYQLGANVYRADARGEIFIDEACVDDLAELLAAGCKRSRDPYGR
jgi:hypothetical protein